MLYSQDETYPHLFRLISCTTSRSLGAASGDIPSRSPGAASGDRPNRNQVAASGDIPSRSLVAACGDIPNWSLYWQLLVTYQAEL